MTVYLLGRDLRLQDNAVFSHLEDAESKLAVVYAPELFSWSQSKIQKNFLFESLMDLNTSLMSVGQKIQVWDKPLKNLFDLPFEKVMFSKVYNSRDHERLENLKKIDSRKAFEVFENTCLVDQKNLPFDLEELPDVFTQYRKKIEKAKVRYFDSYKKCVGLPPYLYLEGAKDFEEWDIKTESLGGFRGGETQALLRLKHYIWSSEAVKTYKDTRNGMLKFDDSTKFSPWLSLGCLSPQSVARDLERYEDKVVQNQSTYWVKFELLWRDYFKYYSLLAGQELFSLNGPGGNHFEVFSDQEKSFKTWRNGETQEPFVNANMNELVQTGWMSNRGRQNVASYLAKELCCDWRKGAEWFSCHLIDYDVESNWGNWAYLAGVGADPRNRKFNIQRQQSIYDPEGAYIKKFTSSL